MMAIEAEAVGKEYERIYKDTIEKFRNSIEKYQEAERQLETKIHNQREQMEHLSGVFK